MCSEEGRDLYRESFKYFKNYTFSPKEKRKQHTPATPGRLPTPVNNGGKSALNDERILLPHPPCSPVPVNCSNSKDEDNWFARESHYDSSCNCECYKMWGLRPPETWEIVELTFPEGLIVIRNPFTAVGQRYWISRTLLDFPHHVDYITNMDNLNRLEKLKRGEAAEKLSDFKLGICGRDFYTKLRWVTFGYHHDWDTKIYSEERKSKFPEDLVDMTRYISQILGFSYFEAEAAIANYYHMDSTLSGHVDRSEVNQDAPLFSLSFGQTAIFLIGGKTKSERPQPVLLRSGDIAIMSGESRLSFHGVPKILPAVDEPWKVHNDDATQNNTFLETSQTPSKRLKYETNGDTTVKASNRQRHHCESFSTTLKEPRLSETLESTKWTKFLETYIDKSRVNLNIRQVLFPGQSCLDSEVQINTNQT